MNELEQVLGLTCQAIRDKLSQADVSEFELEITISGRVDSSDPLKISYLIGKCYDDAKTKGVELGPTVAEYLRRKGWEEKNDYKALPAPKTIAEQIDDEIPF